MQPAVIHIIVKTVTLLLSSSLSSIFLTDFL